MSIDSSVHVEIRKYQGFAGGFATSPSIRYSVYLVNPNKEPCRIKLDGWETGGRGYSSSLSVMGIAKEYSSLLDIPIKHATGDLFYG